MLRIERCLIVSAYLDVIVEEIMLSFVGTENI